MGTYDITIYTAACDVGDCEEIFGDEDDLGWDWFEFSSYAEDAAIRGGWTRVDGRLICKAADAAHDEARGISPDTRPKPGPGQLTLALT